MCGSTIFFNSALDWSGWLTSRTDSFRTGKQTGYPFYRRPGGGWGRSGRVRKTSSTSGYVPRIFKLVDSRFKDYDIPAHL